MKGKTAGFRAFPWEGNYASNTQLPSQLSTCRGTGCSDILLGSQEQEEEEAGSSSIWTKINSCCRCSAGVVDAFVFVDLVVVARVGNATRTNKNYSASTGRIDDFSRIAYPNNKDKSQPSGPPCSKASLLQP